MAGRAPTGLNEQGAVPSAPFSLELPKFGTVSDPSTAEDFSEAPADVLERTSVDLLARQLEEERKAHFSSSTQEWGLVVSMVGLAAVGWATWAHRRTLPGTVRRTLRKTGIRSTRRKGSR